MPAHAFRRTKIIFTLGPATESEEMLEKLIRAGADIVRLNMAHASHDWTRLVIRRIRAVSKRADRDVAIMMDIKGPEIRTGDLTVPLELKAGEIFDFTVKPGMAAGHGGGDEEIRSVDVNYQNLVNDIKVGDTVLVDNGLLRLEVLTKDEARIRCRVLIPGELRSRRHINLPGVKVNLPAFTEKDRGDATVGLEEGIDFLALSFVREAKDIELLRTFLGEKKSKVRIIAKIEDQSAITNLGEIIEACDSLMVARGDLGIECPFEELPVIQRRAVRACLALLRPARSPILAFTPSPEVFRQLRLLRAVEPFLMTLAADPDDTIESAIGLLRREGRIAVGDKIVIATDILANDRLVDSVQLRTVR